MELAAADSEGIDPSGTCGSVDNGTVDGCIGQNDPIHLPKLRFRFGSRSVRVFAASGIASACD
ncbi:hypothetical protein SH528x_006970 [Novipirellula sp. SH528]|uniref:hypothetical protein n=1 Tax=Novipirellula sp. SH528 TaxID=3454466 RepID=UPI003F9F9A2F